MIILLISLGILCMPILVYSQSSRANDPTVSVHNYKHPNKILHAKRLQSVGNLTFSSSKTNPKSYKPQNELNIASKNLPFKTSKWRDVSNDNKVKTLVEFKQKDEVYGN